MTPIHLRTFAEIVAIIEDDLLLDETVQVFDDLAESGHFPFTVDMRRVEGSNERAKTADHGDLARWYADHRHDPIFRT